MFSKGKSAVPAPASARPGDEDVTAASSVFPKFLSAVGRLERPVLLDLGPVVGANVEFFGGRLTCKLHIADLLREIEIAARSISRSGLPAALLKRLNHGPESVDGILCWDVFDYL
ncbi:MAG: hypothetical protein ABIP90_00545, partial [Vicinamibacterales bacterium]